MKAGNRGSKEPTESIDAYVAAFPPEVQAILNKIRALIQACAPDATEAIKYQIPTFVLHGNLVHFAAYENHIGLYPAPSAIEEFKDDLARYKFAKGSIQFPLDAPIPYTLIKKIVKFRVQENRDKAAAKPQKKQR